MQDFLEEKQIYWLVVDQENSGIGKLGSRHGGFIRQKILMND